MVALREEFHGAPSADLVFHTRLALSVGALDQKRARSQHGTAAACSTSRPRPPSDQLTWAGTRKCSRGTGSDQSMSSTLCIHARVRAEPSPARRRRKRARTSCHTSHPAVHVVHKGGALDACACPTPSVCPGHARWIASPGRRGNPGAAYGSHLLCAMASWIAGYSPRMRSPSPW